jgi:hypothetical protein
MARRSLRHSAALAATVVVAGLATTRADAQTAKAPAKTRTAKSGTTPARVAIVGGEYAFIQLPTTLAPGPTLFSFENKGTKRHEMSLALLKSGVTIDVLTRSENRLVPSARTVSDSIVGVLIARPGEHSGGQLYADLIPGRTYAVVCTLKDTPDAQTHLELGMVGSFRVP